MILAMKWNKFGNENRVISSDQIPYFRDLGYVIYEASYRPGLYVTKKIFLESAQEIKKEKNMNHFENGRQKALQDIQNADTWRMPSGNFDLTSKGLPGNSTDYELGSSDAASGKPKKKNMSAKYNDGYDGYALVLALSKARNPQEAMEARKKFGK